MLAYFLLLFVMEELIFPFWSKRQFHCFHPCPMEVHFVSPGSFHHDLEAGLLERVPGTAGPPPPAAARSTRRHLLSARERPSSALGAAAGAGGSAAAGAFAAVGHEEPARHGAPDTWTGNPVSSIDPWKRCRGPQALPCLFAFSSFLVL